MINESNIYQKGVLVATHTGCYYGSKKLSKDQMRGLPEEIVRGVHDMFDKEFKQKINNIGRHNEETREIIKRRSIPFPIDGVYFVPTHLIEGIVDLVTEREKEMNKLVAETVEDYDQAIANFANKYPDFYQASKAKYISKQRFAQRFYFQYQFIKISAPDEDGMISPEQYKLEMRKFRETIEEMKGEVVSTIYQELTEMTNRLKKQCTNGTPNQRTFNSLARFLERVENVYGEFVERKDLKEVIGKIKAEVLGVTAESLRNSEDAKKKFGKAISAVAKEINALPDIPLKRALEF